MSAIFLYFSFLFFLHPASFQAQSFFGFRLGGVSSTLKPRKALVIDGVTKFSRLSDLLSLQVGFGFNHRLGQYFNLDTGILCRLFS